MTLSWSRFNPFISKGDDEARRADSPTRPPSQRFDGATSSNGTDTQIPNSMVEGCTGPLDVSRSQTNTRAQGAVTDTGTMHALETHHMSNQPPARRADIAPSQATRSLVDDLKLRNGTSSSRSGGQDDVQNTTKRRPPTQVSAYTNVPSINASGGHVSASHGGTQAMAASAITNSGQRDPPPNQSPSLGSIPSKAPSGRTVADHLVDTVSPISSLETPNPRDLRPKGSDSVSTKTHEASARYRPSGNDGSSAVPQKAAGTPGNRRVTTETVNNGFRQSANYVQGSSIPSQAKQASMQQDPYVARRTGASVQPRAHSRGVPTDPQAKQSPPPPEALVSNNQPISTGSGSNAPASVYVQGVPTSRTDQSSALSDTLVGGKRAIAMRSGPYAQPSDPVRDVPHSQAERSSELLVLNKQSMAKRSNAIAQSSDLLNDESKDVSYTKDDASKCSQNTQNNTFGVVGVDDLGTEDVIIAVMGPTGAGKSSFVSKAVGSGGDGVGHDLESHTSEIRATRCTIGETSIVLVDTPGFDDTKKTDLEILESIADWLRETYQEGVLLSGLLYFHRITDNRMAGTPLKNLRVFRQLCGDDAMSRIVLTTTMWDEVDEEVGNQRLEELKESYWKPMIKQGSMPFRYWNTQESATELLHLVAKKRREVRLQKEIGDKHMELRETSAGQELHSRLDQLAASQMQVLERLRAQLKDGPTEDLRKEFEMVKAQLDDTLRQSQALKLNAMQRTMAFFRRRIGL